MIAFKHVLVPIDFGDASARALELALDIATKFESKVTLVHASWVPPYYYYGYAEGLVWPMVDLESQAQKALDAAVTRAKARYPKVDGALMPGEPWERILAASKERGADLIVMGTHGRRGLSRVFLGSVAEKIVRLSPIPVLTVCTESDSPRTRLMTGKTAARTLVAIVASAGGVEAVSRVLSGLPTDLQAAVAIVQHRPTASRESLVDVLQRATGLPVKLAEEGESLFTSRVYLAPPDAHLTVLVDGSVRLLDGPRIRHVLSSAKPLFESAPDAFGANVIAVVLAGCDLDGTEGVQRVAEAGGSVIAEDLTSAIHSRISQSTIAPDAVEYVLPLSAIASRIVHLVEERAIDVRGSDELMPVS